MPLPSGGFASQIPHYLWNLCNDVTQWIMIIPAPSRKAGYFLWLDQRSISGLYHGSAARRLLHSPLPRQAPLLSVVKGFLSALKHILAMKGMDLSISREHSILMRASRSPVYFRRFNLQSGTQEIHASVVQANSWDFRLGRFVEMLYKPLHRTSDWDSILTKYIFSDSNLWNGDYYPSAQLHVHTNVSLGSLKGQLSSLLPGWLTCGCSHSFLSGLYQGAAINWAKISSPTENNETLAC